MPASTCGLESRLDFPEIGKQFFICILRRAAGVEQISPALNHVFSAKIPHFLSLVAGWNRT
jgi:hypothetical protein